jgi:hypothetical protein
MNHINKTGSRSTLENSGEELIGMVIPFYYRMTGSPLSMRTVYKRTVLVFPKAQLQRGLAMHILGADKQADKQKEKS